jgi:hypothetical protein
MTRIKEMSELLNTISPRHFVGFGLVFITVLNVVSLVRNSMETRRARREKFDAEFAELRADMANLKAAVHAVATGLADLRSHFDLVAGKMDKTADRIDAAVTRLNTPTLRIVPAAE